VRPIPTVETLAAGFSSGAAIEAGRGREAIDADAERLAALLNGDAAARGLRLWTNTKCLVTTRRFAALPTFARAAAESAARGWPVHVRTSGGTTVVHRPGMLNVSAFDAWIDDGRDVTKAFERFCGRLVAVLRSAGVDADVGWVPFSHCDGRFNLTVAGRKIGGTASLVRRRRSMVAMLAHASIWIEGDVMVDLEAVERFERDIGCGVAYNRSAHASICDAMAEGRSVGHANGQDARRYGDRARVSAADQAVRGAGACHIAVNIDGHCPD